MTTNDLKTLVESMEWRDDRGMFSDWDAEFIETAVIGDRVTFSSCASEAGIVEFIKVNDDLWRVGKVLREAVR